MVYHLKSLVCLFFCFLAISSYSQGNTDTLCEVKKLYESTPFGIKQKVVSSSQQNILADPHISPLLADMDGDGLPEMITQGQGGSIIIIDPVTGLLVRVIQTPHLNWVASTTSLVLVDVDFDGVLEIIVATADYNNAPNLLDKLVCYNYDGSLRWISDRRYEGTNDNDVTGTPAVADFNGDGIPEVYILNKIFNAQTGILLAMGNSGTGIHDYNNNVNGWIDLGTSVTIAANLDDNPNDLELAAGYTVYKVSIVNTNGTAGNTMVAHDILVDNMKRDGRTVVADINLDGKLDIIVSSTRYNNQARIYVYTFRNGQCFLLAKDNPKFSNYRLDTPLVGDNNSDGIPEIYINNGAATICYLFDGSVNLVRKWVLGNNNNLEYYFNMMYDFNNDGLKELVFIHENKCKFYNDINNVLTELTSSSDVVGYRPTSNNLVVTKQYDCQETALLTIYYSTTGGYFRTILVEFTAHDSTANWAPPQNWVYQYQSHPLFRNDDGSVPANQENHATFKNKKFNHSLPQVNIVDEDGYYTVPALSLTGGLFCLQYDISSDEFTVDFFLHNKNNSLSCYDSIPISLYEGNPALGGKLIKTIHVTELINPGDSLTGFFNTLNSDITDTIWMLVNVNKTITNLSDEDSYHLPECDYSDNVFKITLPKFEHQEYEICQGDTIVFYDQQLFSQGTFLHKIKNIDQCDSFVHVMNLRVINEKTEIISMQTCDSLQWNGLVCDTSGTYTFQTTSFGGCDSLISLDLTLHFSDEESIFRTSCNNFMWNDSLISQSGVYVFKSKNKFGCDSIQTLNLEILESYESLEEIKACNFFEWNGNLYSESGQYYYLALAKNGCDSLLELSLTITETDSVIIQERACDQFFWNNELLDKSGLYKTVNQNVFGCDSTTILDLSISSSNVTSLNLSFCDSVLFNGQVFFEDGLYTFEYKNQFGCDSTVNVEMQFNATLEVTEIKSCNSFVWPANGKTYTSSGIFKEALTNSFGCDSILILELSIAPEYEVQIPIQSCVNYFWDETGENYSQSGNFTHYLQTEFGCDSIIILQLDLLSAHEYFSTVETHSPFLWDINDQSYSQSGEYVAKYLTKEGCDSIYYLNLTILENTDIHFPNIISNHGDNCCFTGYSSQKNLFISTMSVFDRNGNLVFFKEDLPLNDSSLGWDGTFKGKDVISGVYVWLAELKDSDGQTKTFFGDVTVLKN